MTSRDEWLAWRREGIGASDIGALMGLSPYASPTSLYYEKVGLLDDDRPDSDRLRIGRSMEPVLASEFHERTGLYCSAMQSQWVHPEHPFARCTLDGLASEAPDGDPLGVVEFKTDGRLGWDEIPSTIRAQCVWQMGVTQTSHAWLLVMFAGFRVEIHEIPLDDDARSDWEFMLAVASTFWSRYVETGTPPPVDDHPATTEALTDLYDPIPDSYLDADNYSRGLIADIHLIQDANKIGEATETRLKNELRALLADRTDLIDGWGPPRGKRPPKPNVLASWRPQTRHDLDRKAIRTAYPDLVEAYTVESTQRVLRITPTTGESPSCLEQ